MNKEKTFKKSGTLSRNLVLFFILGMSALLLSKLMFMLSAFLGAVTLYILFRKLHKRLTYRYHWNTISTTALIISCSLILVLLPLYMIATVISHKLSPVFSDPTPIVNSIQQIQNFINQYVEFSLISPGNINKVTKLAETVLTSLLDSGASLLTNLIIMYFLLWFMLNNGFAMERWLKINSPFSRKNTQRIFDHIKIGITSNAIGIIILGLIQGAIAMIGYMIFGVNDPLLWGLITAAASVIPFVGTMLAYVPLSILLMANGDMFNGIGMFLYGLLIVGSSDNVFRFLLQKKMASTHPIITVLGVFAGLSLFGFWGLIYGPLLISLVILISKVYKEEFKNS